MGYILLSISLLLTFFKITRLIGFVSLMLTAGWFVVATFKESRKLGNKLNFALIHQLLSRLGNLKKKRMRAYQSGLSVMGLVSKGSR